MKKFQTKWKPSLCSLGTVWYIVYASLNEIEMASSLILKEMPLLEAEQRYKTQLENYSKGEWNGSKMASIRKNMEILKLVFL